MLEDPVSWFAIGSGPTAELRFDNERPYPLWEAPVIRDLEREMSAQVELIVFVLEPVLRRQQWRYGRGTTPLPFPRGG